jgi:DNA-binding NarL/FixJ family response regulator
MLRVFLADDHAVVREGLKKLINDDTRMAVVGEASNGQDCFSEASKILPDVIVMDISMPQMNGIVATKNEIMKAGASGYVLKLAAANELIHAISTVAENRTYLDPSLAAKLITQASQTDQDESWTAKLSVRETEVVRLIAQGYTNKEIASQMQIGIKSVETYKARSMTKLGLRSRADFVRYALGKGWLGLD